MDILGTMVISLRRKDCVPKCSIRDLLVRKAHEGGLKGRFAVQKSYDTLREHFNWPHMKRDFQSFMKIAFIVKRPNQKSNPRFVHSFTCSL